MVESANASLLKARFWHDRAEEAWSMASQLADPVAKSTMVEIAERYEILADAMVLKEAMVHGRDNHRVGRRVSMAPGTLL
ncbi:MAG TPA: hypothetical protein VEC60_19000 [Reyranella sp.]|nr:hypothetical protein [Reyranella sp.]